MRSICPLCEATCGVRVTLENNRPVEVRGDEYDRFSRGYICPKGVALAELHNDPDRLCEPLYREGSNWRAITWEEAFERIDHGWQQLWAKYGRQALGIYLGNPSSHNTPFQLYGFPLFKALGTPNFFSASTADQMPKHVSTGHLFGDPMSIPIPDINRTHYLLILGANPVESNGSLMTAPDLPCRLKAIQQRGGEIVVIDPRRTRTAKMADRYHAIVPGTDVYFLAALVHQLIEEDRVASSQALDLCTGYGSLCASVQPFTPERVAKTCGMTSESIRTIARELAEAPSAAIHARMGTTTQDHGTLASWLVDVIHILTGNIDRPGGAMFTKVAHGAPNAKGMSGTGKGFTTGRHRSRVREYPEVMGEFPCGAMAEEILTPGSGQIRGMLTACGNPVLSTPDGGKLDEALASLEFMVSFDIYLNETTRHANIILPDVTPLERPHYDLIFNQLAIHNYARYAPAALPLKDRPAGWEVLLRLTAIALGHGPNADLDALDEQGLRKTIEREQRHETSRIAHLEVDAILEALSARCGPERHLDLLLRSGPYGDAFNESAEGLSLAALEAAPEGIDLGPLQPRLPEILRTPSGRIELAPALFTDALQYLAPRLSTNDRNGDLLLIGRRHLRSNNSWMHNIPSLVTGKDRCTLMIHPDTAAKLQLKDGTPVTATTETGTIHLPLEVTEDIMPGIVSIPHGWGHTPNGMNLTVATQHPGANMNQLTNGAHLEPFSGNAVLNGIPVALSPVSE